MSFPIRQDDLFNRHWIDRYLLRNSNLQRKLSLFEILNTFKRYIFQRTNFCLIARGTGRARIDYRYYVMNRKLDQTWKVSKDIEQLK